MTLVCCCAFQFLAPHHAMSQDDFLADFLIQRLPDAQAYVEVQTSWSSNVDTPSDSLTITTVAYLGDAIAAFQKENVIARPVVEDSIELRHVHVNRLKVPPGSIRLEWLIERNQIPIWLHNENVRVPIGGMPEFTDLMIVNTFGQATVNSDPDMVHSGLDLIPLVGRSIPLQAQAARFYVELHGMSEVVGLDSLFLLVYGWADQDGNWDEQSTKYSRQKAAQVVPIFEYLSCTQHTPDAVHPVLKLEARTREGNVVVSRDVQLPSRWSNNSESVVKIEGESMAVSPLPSLLLFDSRDGMIRHMEDHLAIAATNEQNTIKNLINQETELVQMQQYLTSFWLERSTSFGEAVAQHEEYCSRIEYVDAQFGDCKNGQGSLTEMGNIYLRFGKPNTVVKRHHETDYYPYEIWHYYKAGRFNNKRFLYYAPHVVGECFELLHSDMLGERQNEDWLAQLRTRENTTRVTQTMENRLNPRGDTFSREEPEDLFFNPR